MILGGNEAWLRLSPLSAAPGGGRVIELEVNCDRGEWSTRNTGLHRNDLRELARWLRAVGRGRRPKELGFTEPNLSFECLSTDESVRIRVWFEGEARPSWAPWEHWSMHDLSLDLELPRDELAEAAEMLRGELDRVEARPA